MCVDALLFEHKNSGKLAYKNIEGRGHTNHKIVKYLENLTPYSNNK